MKDHTVGKVGKAQRKILEHLALHPGLFIKTIEVDLRKDRKTVDNAVRARKWGNAGDISTMCERTLINYKCI